MEAKTQKHDECEAAWAREGAESKGVYIYSPKAAVYPHIAAVVQHRGVLKGCAPTKTHVSANKLRKDGLEPMEPWAVMSICHGVHESAEGHIIRSIAERRKQERRQG